MRPTEDSFLSLVWVLCRRPGLFTVDSTAFEIWAFIHGLETALFPDTPYSGRPLAQLSDWLTKRYSLGAADSWHFLIREYPDQFVSMTKDGIWDLLRDYFLERHGIKYEPVKITPCGYSDPPRRKAKKRG